MKNIPIITTALLVFISLIFLWQRFIIGYPIFILFPNGNFTLSDFLAHFSHFYIFHFAMNAVGVFLVGRILEPLLGSKKFFIVFLAITIFTTVGMEYFSLYPALGISGVLLGLFIFLGIRVRHNRAFFHSILRLTVLNIALGFIPGVSLAGHIIGVLSGVLVYGLCLLLKKCR